jgi:hypothetical protein
VSHHQWEAITAEVLAQLGLQPVETDRWCADLERFAGTYLLDEKRTFELVVERGRLFARRFPFFWREVATELVLDGTTSFFVRSWPTVGAFDMRKERALSVTFRELAHAGQPPWPSGTYRRVD